MTQSEREHWELLRGFDAARQYQIFIGNYKMARAYLRAKLYYMKEWRRITDNEL